MAQLGKGKLNYRCPSCFLRDLDIDMFYNKETEMIRFRYKAMHDRITKFDFD